MKKRIFAFFGSLALALGGGIAALAPTALEAKAESETTKDFGAEEEVSREELAVSLTGSSMTSTSQSLALSMSATMIEAFSNGSRYNNVFVRITDENYIDLKTATDQAKKAQEDATEENPFVPAVYEARVYNIVNKNLTNGVVVLPQYVSYGTNFRLRVTGIDPEVCYDHENLKAVSYEGIKTIVIPSGYTSISADAFVGAKAAGVQIKTAEAAPLPGWEEGWTDADVTYSYTAESYSRDEKKLLEVTSGQTKSFGEAKNFFVGYFDEAHPENNLPLTMEYNLVNAKGEIVKEHCYYELPKESTTLPYDAVGSMAGKTKDTRYIDIEISDGAQIDVQSVVFHNIRRLIRDEGGLGVMIDPDAAPLKAKPLISFTNPVNFSDFFTFTPSQATHFSGYSRFSVSAKANYDTYKTMNPSAYENNKALLESGDLRIRILFSSLANASYRIVYENASGEEITKTIMTRTPVTATEIEDGSDVGFLIKDSDVAPDFSIEKARSVQLCGFFVQIDLFNTVKNSIANNSKKTYRFANVELLPTEGIAGVSTLSIENVFIIAYSCYVALFVLGAFAYYFYSKRKYRNDEFRRMNNKKYLIKSAKNLVGFALILSSILFIVARWALFDNTIVVFNPLDAWVIVFTLLGAIFLGFTIKDTVVSIKQTIDRKKKEKLHLDADVAEDGTK